MPGRSRATGGSGLGLAIVKHVLQRHGATLDIESTLGSGQHLHVPFPARRGVDASESRALEAASPQSRRYSHVSAFTARNNSLPCHASDT